MDQKLAYKILGIEKNTYIFNISLEYLKKQYRKMALKHHPDKNGNTQESTLKFQQINEAYQCLKREIIISNQYCNTEDTEYETTSSDLNSSLYFDILKEFMKTVFEGTYNEILSKVVKDIIITGKKITATLFDELDKDTVLNIYSFLSNHRLLLHLSEEVLDMIRGIVVKKYDNVQIYKLNPSINDLINNNVYKLHVNDELFLVPLWNNESYYDSSGCEIIVICEPELPHDITIDEDNNICINYSILLRDDLYKLIQENEKLYVTIGSKIFPILLSQLYMKSEQFYIIKNEGLPKPHIDMYDISEKTDIIVKIILL
uniref:J domain-containing protein n=1 Tax=viral metagenome TaxID=1070528 RepID=A0A6C0AS78_9ZZZZ